MLLSLISNRRNSFKTVVLLNALLLLPKSPFVLVCIFRLKFPITISILLTILPAVSITSPSQYFTSLYYPSSIQADTCTLALNSPLFNPRKWTVFLWPFVNFDLSRFFTVYFTVMSSFLPTTLFSSKILVTLFISICCFSFLLFCTIRISQFGFILAYFNSYLYT